MWRKLLDYLLSLLSGGTAKPPPDPPPPTDPPAGSSGLLALHNVERREAGLQPLAADDRLDRAARKYAELMAARDQLSHTIGGNFGDRLLREGFMYSRAGENIAAGQRTPEDAVAAWMHSPGHRDNVLGDYRLAGFGHAASARGTPYWCADFGTEQAGGRANFGPLNTPGPCGDYP